MHCIDQNHSQTNTGELPVASENVNKSDLSVVTNELTLKGFIKTKSKMLVQLQ